MLYLSIEILYMIVFIDSISINDVRFRAFNPGEKVEEEMKSYCIAA